jgi:hypothetical protein
VLFALKQGLISPRLLDHACPNAIVKEKNADRRDVTPQVTVGLCAGERRDHFCNGSDT